LRINILGTRKTPKIEKMITGFGQDSNTERIYSEKKISHNKLQFRNDFDQSIQKAPQKLKTLITI
jgi:hypothetical protein